VPTWSVPGYVMSVSCQSINGHKRGRDWKIIQAHRHPGILLHARCGLAFAWPFIVSSGARSCRARSFTACCWLVVVSSLLCCCTLPLLLPAPVLLLSFYILPSRIHSLLGLFTHSITHSLPRHTY
jgi:hypothetical protein